MNCSYIFSIFSFLFCFFITYTIFDIRNNDQIRSIFSTRYLAISRDFFLYSSNPLLIDIYNSQSTSPISHPTKHGITLKDNFINKRNDIYEHVKQMRNVEKTNCLFSIGFVAICINTIHFISELERRLKKKKNHCYKKSIPSLLFFIVSIINNYNTANVIVLNNVTPVEIPAE